MYTVLVGLPQELQFIIIQKYGMKNLFLDISVLALLQILRCDSFDGHTKIIEDFCCHVTLCDVT